MKWKITTKKREDNMWEAEALEMEGLFTIGVMATEESAIKEAKSKVQDPFAEFFQTAKETAEWEKEQKELQDRLRLKIEAR